VDPDHIRKAIESALVQTTKLIEGKLNDRNREVAALQKEGQRIVERIKRLVDNDDVKVSVNVRHNEPFTVSPASTPAFRAKPQTAAIGTNGKLGKGETKILTAIAQHEDGVNREQLTVLTGYKRSSRDTYLQRLGAAGLVELGPTITATAEGVATLGSDFEPLPTGRALQEYWLQRLTGGEQTILEALIDVHPKPMTRDQISDVTEYKRSSRDTYLQRLKARQLITVAGASVAASDRLF
jgi:predicted transcriptional regulator